MEHDNFRVRAPLQYVVWRRDRKGDAMKVLVATTETQGARVNDFSWTDENELVMFGSECDGEEIDGRCGCRRSLSGVNTRKGTTTFKVVDTEITREELVDTFKRSLEKAQFTETAKEAEAIADGIIEIAESFEAGQILERRGDEFLLRDSAA